MSDDKRLVKFEFLMRDINKALGSSVRNGRYNATLSLIYDREQLNEFGKIIFKCSQLRFYVGEKWYFLLWQEKYGKDLSSAFKDERKQFEAAKELVTSINEGNWATDRYIYRYKGEGWRSDAYRFIFWALMVLAVDETDKEEHLSEICDFAKMLKISDDEVADIINVIKYIFQNKTAKEIKTLSVKTIFKNVPNIYGDSKNSK